MSWSAPIPLGPSARLASAAGYTATAVELGDGAFLVVVDPSPRGQDDVSPSAGDDTSHEVLRDGNVGLLNMVWQIIPVLVQQQREKKAKREGLFRDPHGPKLTTRPIDMLARGDQVRVRPRKDGTGRTLAASPLAMLAHGRPAEAAPDDAPSIPETAALAVVDALRAVGVDATGEAAPDGAPAWVVRVPEADLPFLVQVGEAIEAQFPVVVAPLPAGVASGVVIAADAGLVP